MADPRLRRIGRCRVDGAKIRKAREALGWNRTQLAAAVGVVERTVYRFEDEDHPPSPAIAQRLAQVLGLSPEELFAPEETPEVA